MAGASTLMAVGVVRIGKRSVTSTESVGFQQFTMRTAEKSDNRYNVEPKSQGSSEPQQPSLPIFVKLAIALRDGD